jgi:heme/copper-type cytochrome/quinol oxidase subunit 2
MKFGMDVASIAGQKALGVSPDYAMFWAGSWNEKYGFGGISSSAKSAADQGVVPVVQWWYWGDDISQSCVLNGCNDRYQNVWKNESKWQADGTKVADMLHQGLAGRPGIVVLETEFNKGSIQGWSAFNDLLQGQVSIFRQHAPEVQLVLGLGNWAQNDWPTWKPAASAMDMVGFQTMRGSTRVSDAVYNDTVSAIARSSALVRDTFGKPVLLDDFALCSYPEPAYADMQNKVITELFQRVDELKGDGLSGVVYRALTDNSGANTANYYGTCEKYFGFKHADGSAKPALATWVQGVKAERVPPFAASFTPKAQTNEWWVEVAVSANRAVAGVEASLDGGAWQSLPADSWGTFAASLHAPYGTKVQFRASDADGDSVLSASYWWGPTTPPPFTASFAPVAQTNDWWVEANVSASQDVVSVEASLNGSAWKALPLQDWGDYAASLHAAYPTKVQFRATNATGAHALSTTYTWGTPPPPKLTATFKPKSVGNDWWVEVDVASNLALSKVEASLNGGAWQALALQDWGSWAASLHAPNGTKVQFRATSSDGQHALSTVTKWS